MSKKDWQREVAANTAAGSAQEAGPSAAHDPPAGPESEGIQAGGWQQMSKPTSRRFPEPGPINEPIRIDLSAQAWTDMSAQARQSLDAEVCGVLVGELCEDEHGLWVAARGAIPGTSARQGGAHVTYTQETWQKIYEVKDRQYPKLQIVGWYHSHPGFGVTFSEMDLFIQQNFFAGPTQFALVLDPLTSEEAVCVNTPEGIQYVRHIWVEGRRRACRAADPKGPGSEAVEGASSGVEMRLAQVEQRLQQVLQATEEDRGFRHRVLLLLGMLFSMAVLAGIGLMIYNQLTWIPTPPRLLQYADVPVQIGDKVVLLGISLHAWKVPPELNAALVAIEKERLLEEAAKREASTPKPSDQKLSAPAPKASAAPSPGGSPWAASASEDSSSRH